MAVDLSECILPVRGEISDIPEEYVTDIQIFRDLKKAKAFVDMVVVSGLSDATLKPIYEAAGAYYTYINWTGVAEKKMGTTPSTSFFRVAVLREKVLQLMGTNLTVPLNENLTINYRRISKMTATAATLSASLIDDSP